MGRKLGRYETLGLIARGGMASVYLGRALGAGGFERLVAIKVMHEHIAEDHDAQAMFLDEARLAARIRHPNVVPTLDVADDGSFIVMEYVEGASLSAILKRLRHTDEQLPLSVTLKIMLDVLDGLDEAHELCDADGKPLRIVHRDVSPHNILVGVDGIARITDFGIAYAEARITSTRGGELKGKLPYMAPEQLEDAPCDRRTDVYAAGCVLWEMLTGRRLFSGKTEAAVACAVLSGPHASPREVNPAVPEDIDSVCMRALARADDRPETALALAQALQTAAARAGIAVATRHEVKPHIEATALTNPRAATITESKPEAAARDETATDVTATLSSTPEPDDHDDAVEPARDRPPESAVTRAAGRMSATELSVTPAADAGDEVSTLPERRGVLPYLIGAALVVLGGVGAALVFDRGDDDQVHGVGDAPAEVSDVGVVVSAAAPSGAATAEPSLAAAKEDLADPYAEATAPVAAPTASAARPAPAAAGAPWVPPRPDAKPAAPPAAAPAPASPAPAATGYHPSLP